MSSQQQTYFVPSGISVKKLSQTERDVIKSLFFNRGHKVIIHTAKISASAEWVNVAGKYTIKVETDSTMY
jgi:hypothetical protein